MATMKIIGLVTGEPTPYDGQYLVEYDTERDGLSPDGQVMNCYLITSPHIENALDLPKAEMVEVWRRVSKRSPLRPDGNPSRPLTAYTVEIT